MDDENRWLEDIDGDRALGWVRARNERTESTLFEDPRFAACRDRVLAILESDDRIPVPTRHGELVHNFWTDAEHRRGILRRTGWTDYLSGTPTWETVLDVDALGRDESESWVFAGSTTRRPDRRRTLVALSPGGTDATTTREFDLVERAFVSEEDGGFVRPVAKGDLVWIDADTVFVTTDFGAGSMTRSGYPRAVRRWRRGTPMTDAEIVFEAAADDMGVWVTPAAVSGRSCHLIERMLDFYRAEHLIILNGDVHRLDLPDHVEVWLHGRWLAVRNRHEWELDGRAHAPGSVFVADVDDLVAGEAVPAKVFSPTEHEVLERLSWTRNRLVLTVLRDVRSEIRAATLGDDGWHTEALPGMPECWTLQVGAVDADASDDLWVWADDFLTPPTLALHASDGATREVAREPERFDPTGLAISQHFATSADGTRVPYFEIGPVGRSGPLPTVMRGYGGFEISETAVYAATVGAAWLESGNVYVQANIRGGGEYGPAWHHAGLRENRHRVYEDFEAVADDLVARGVTTIDRLGCTGGSNGGLLVGNMYVREPQRFGAIVCQVPLLDMHRYAHLLAGASWMAEYGDPDDADDWAFLRTFSPYHLIDAKGDHPPILFTTSTRDDRVHPGHARKMAARLLAAGKDVTYWENIEGGHGGAADASQRATMTAAAWTFLRDRLGA